MRRVLLMLVCLWSWMLPLQTWAEEPQKQAPLVPPIGGLVGADLMSQPAQPQQCPPGHYWYEGWGRCVNEALRPKPPLTVPSIGKIPYEEAQKIWGWHREELMKLPGVQQVWLGVDGIRVETDNPLEAPQEIEGVPVKAMPPSIRYLPPPPGVIVLRPSRVYGQAEACPARFMRAWKNLKGYVCYEQADSCPQGFREEGSQGGWRFCLDPKQPETVPALMAPPIAGIPFYEAMAILDRRQQELMQLPGVESVGLGAEGIQVGTSNPAVVPSQVEELPIKIIPPLGPWLWDLGKASTIR